MLFRISLESTRGSVKSKAVIAELKDHVLTLRLSLREYRWVRNRFISTFKRDKLNNADGSDIKIIQEGNLTVHGGDAVVDARLYLLK